VKYDAFVSHASEDKDLLVRPLVRELRAFGANLWYDEFALGVGDSLRTSLDRGLRDSRYGIVILSPAFFNKGWTGWELDGLVHKHLSTSSGAILPVWHDVTAEDVAQYSASLSNIVALKTTTGIPALAAKLMAKISPESVIDFSSVDDAIMLELRNQVARFPFLTTLVRNGVPIDELMTRVIRTPGFYSLMHYYFERGVATDYDPHSKGLTNMIADENIDTDYTELRNRLRLLYHGPSRAL
jgi:hypothetical protein